MEFWEIYDQYYFRVRKFIQALVKDEWVADDLIQEAFLKVQHNLENLKDPSRLSPWIFRIAYNLCQDHFRQKKRSRREVSLDGEIEERPEEPWLQKRVEQGEMSDCVQAQLNLLPESLRTILIMSDIMEFSHQEMAEVLGITVQNAKVRIHRARKKLKVLLEKACTFEKDERNVLVCLPALKGPKPSH
jgi:RNA polymerase sigma-70 factor (ECF subfamily)